MTCVVRTYIGVPGRTPMVGRGMGKVATPFSRMPPTVNCLTRNIAQLPRGSV